jgi:arginine exporter protein ArgO
MVSVPFGIARRFGKGRLFGVGAMVLPFVFFPILGFGVARYSPVTTPESQNEG